jgi:hypothetical protein
MDNGQLSMTIYQLKINAYLFGGIGHCPFALIIAN